jgi:hypothetical protein
VSAAEIVADIVDGVRDLVAENDALKAEIERLKSSPSVAPVINVPASTVTVTPATPIIPPALVEVHVPASVVNVAAAEPASLQLDATIDTGPISDEIKVLASNIEAMGQIAAADRTAMAEGLTAIAGMLADAVASFSVALEQHRAALSVLESAMLAPREGIITRDGEGRIVATRSNPVLN